MKLGKANLASKSTQLSSHNTLAWLNEAGLLNVCLGHEIC